MNKTVALILAYAHAAKLHSATKEDKIATAVAADTVVADQALLKEEDTIFTDSVGNFFDKDGNAVDEFGVPLVVTDNSTEAADGLGEGSSSCGGDMIYTDGYGNYTNAYGNPVDMYGNLISQAGCGQIPSTSSTFCV